MPMLTILHTNKTSQFVEGARLLDAILAAEESFTHKCEGKAECGSCHYQSLSGGRGLFRLPHEQLSLAKAPWNNGKGAAS